MRGKFIAGLIGTEYSKDDQIALLANCEDTAAHAEELAKFKEVRAAAKNRNGLRPRPDMPDIPGAGGAANNYNR